MITACSAQFATTECQSSNITLASMHSTKMASSVRVFVLTCLACLLFAFLFRTSESLPTGYFNVTSKEVENTSSGEDWMYDEGCIQTLLASSIIAGSILITVLGVAVVALWWDQKCDKEAEEAASLYHRMNVLDRINPNTHPGTSRQRRTKYDNVVVLKPCVVSA